MNRLIILLFLFSSHHLLAQSLDSIPIQMFQGGKSIDGPFNLTIIGKDTLYHEEASYINSEVLHTHSIRICHNKCRLLIRSRNEEVFYINIYLTRRTFMKRYGHTKFGIGNPFRKSYYVDLGQDVIFRIQKSKRNLCLY